jgi:alpha-L-rhamnosidase
MAFLKASDWKAKWIEPGYAEDLVMRPSPLMRKQFALSKKVASATAYITAHGMYEAQLNGIRIGDAYLTPGWTAYQKRLQYQVYDVTSLVKTGSNVMGVTLGNGWYRGIIGFANNVNVYGRDIALLCQLEINYSDGSSERILSDATWKSSTGSILYSEIYNGEVIDARLEKSGWTMPGYNDSEWSAVKETSHPMEVLIATWNEPVKKHETIAPVRIFKTPAGEQVIDFGQNLVGWVQMTVTGKAGDKVILSHAEVLDKAGNFYTENLRQAKAQNTYILKGDAAEVFEPHFTWQGFRYVKIEGYPGEIRPENFKAMVLYSAMKPTGTFTSSDELINQLQHNIQWGQKGNFLDVPTDCPQRDERLGWTGDAQAFSRTAAFNMNVNNFFAKWMRDVEADQVDGKVPFVVPNVLGREAVNSTGWADVATIVPWNMYLVYGDKKLLEQQYGSMKAYVESIRTIANNDLWNTGFHFGDWLFYRPDDDNDGRAAVTDKYLIAQCFYAGSTQLLINAAGVLGKNDDVAFYTVLLQKIKEAFMKEYVTPNGRLVSGTQTAYVLALNFDMLPEALRTQAADRLAENVQRYDHLTTGFLGTPYLCHVLTRFGYTDLAYQLLLRKEYPSWLYPVTMGATTIWERWDGQKPDSTFQTPGMNSFNHYAYGAIGDWMYRVMAGLDTHEDGVGYRHSRIKPHMGGGITNASASLDTYYGKLSCAWKLDADKLTMDIEIPANTTATVYVPAIEAAGVLESGKAISAVKEITLAGLEEGYVVLKVGSGKYRFTR